jgi:hypothetical protein
LDEITLSDAAKRLYQMFGERAPSYRQLCDRAMDGRVPAFKRGRTWMLKLTDLERVATRFDLRPFRRAVLAPVTRRI